MKTIKQIAEELGVSKQAIHQKIKKEPLSTSLQPFISRSDNMVYIKDEGVKLIASAFSSTSGVNNVSIGDNGIIAFLKEQLKEKDKQISEKDKQIDTLSSALLAAQQTAAAAQALHAGTIKRLDGDEPLSDERQVTNTDSEEKSKKGFMARFFKK